MNTFETPKCDVCNIIFKAIPELDVHMKRVHNESEYKRLERIQMMATAALKAYKNTNERVTLENKKERKLSRIEETGEDVVKEPIDEEEVKDEINEEEDDIDFSDIEEEDAPFVETKYKEKTWPAGHSFKSKSKAFGASLKYFGVLLKRRKIQMIEDVKFRTLSHEIRSGAIEIELEIIDTKFKDPDKPFEKPKKIKGMAKIKIWAPNPKNPKKKEFTVMVEKHSEHDKKFVKILALKVVKPILDSFLTGEGPVKLLNTTFDNTKIHDYNCDMCHMRFDKDKGLKIHKGKVHSEKKRKTMEGESDKSYNCHLCHFVSNSPQIVNNHYKAVHSSKQLKNDNKCEVCDWIGASKETLKSHMISQHLDSNIGGGVELRKDKTNCTYCEYSNLDETDLKRHYRDEHKESAISPSTSPPKKKSKESLVVVQELIECLISLEMEEVMEEDEQKSETLGIDEKDKQVYRKIINPDTQIEEMDEDTYEICKRMNDKVIAKQKKQGEDENEQHNKIPERFRKLFELRGWLIEDFRLMQTGGGGKCGPFCISLHISCNTNQATSIRTNINCFMVDHWVDFKQNFQFPCIERVGTGSREFKDDKKLRAFLLDHPDAASMWMTHAGMQAASDMQNMNINILTTGVKGLDPICIRCLPRQSFNNHSDLRDHEEDVHGRFETAEEKEGKIQNARWTILKPNKRGIECENKAQTKDMFLMHEDDVHYSLIVHKDHELFKKLSSPFSSKSPQVPPQGTHVSALQSQEANLADPHGKIADPQDSTTGSVNSVVRSLDKSVQSVDSESKCKVCKLHFTNNHNLNSHMKTAHVNEFVSELEKKLKENAIQIDWLQSEQSKTVQEMRNMRVLLVKANNQIKILGEFKQLSEQTNKCNLCDEGFKTVNDLEIHKISQHVEEGRVFTCGICGFKTNCENSLNTHEKNHKGITCRKCGEKCETDEHLRNHLREAHPRRMKVKEVEEEPAEVHIHCNKPLCPEEEKLTKKEIAPIVSQNNEFKCRNCKQEFTNKWLLMNHRRDNHHDNRRMCYYDAENKCTFSAELCWYKHKDNKHKQIHKDQSFQCYTCHNKFENLPLLMRHRKQNHLETVKPCSKFKEGKCDKEQSCWFTHIEVQVDFQMEKEITTPP